MDDLVKRADEALKDVTPGPWFFGLTGEEQRLILGGPSENYVANVQIFQTPRNMGAWQEPEREANASFIAAARELVPAMRDRIEADAKIKQSLIDENYRYQEKARKAEARIAELEAALRATCQREAEGIARADARAETAEARIAELDAALRRIASTSESMSADYIYGGGESGHERTARIARAALGEKKDG